jgi:putative hydrolase of the HAD superfamily
MFSTPHQPGGGPPTTGRDRLPSPPLRGAGSLDGRPRRAGTGLTLFIDADDTLWENNVYFEAVVQHYCRLLEARGIDHACARETLLAIERVRTKTNGYGIANFNQSLREAFRQLVPGDCSGLVAEIDEHCAGIRRREMELLDGVEATLAALAARHRLVLFTKGDEADQRDKVTRSGLARWFGAVDVVKEKHPDAYRHALARHGVREAEAWMVGNSPRSDVAPALAVGMGAVFVPHPATWVLELDPLPEGPHERLLVLERFDQLVEWF